MKRTVAGKIEIGMPKRIRAASFSEAERAKREKGDSGREVVEKMRRKQAKTGEVEEWRERNKTEGHEETPMHA